MEVWNITRTLYKVSDFVSWQRNGSLQLSPSFQRRPVWSESAKSFLMDTIVRGLPIPIIFVREQSDLNTLEPIRQIVDGQQRIRTLLSYVDANSLKDWKPARDAFAIKKVHNKEMAGKDFADLSPELKQRILNYQFSVHILPTDTDDKQVLQIFARMNATGVKLNNQELRNASYFGEFKQSMYNLAYEQLTRWRKWNIFSENNIARMDEVDLTSDLVMMMIRGISEKTKATLDKCYEAHDDVFQEKTAIENRFQVCMDLIDDLIGKDLVHMEFHKKTLFYTLFCLVYDFYYDIGSSLLHMAKKRPPANLATKLRILNDKFYKKQAPEKILELTTRRTTIKSSRTQLFNYCKGICLESD